MNNFNNEDLIIEQFSELIDEMYLPNNCVYVVSVQSRDNTTIPKDEYVISSREYKKHQIKIVKKTTVQTITSNAEIITKKQKPKNIGMRSKGTMIELSNKYSILSELMDRHSNVYDDETTPIDVISHDIRNLKNIQQVTGLRSEETIRDYVNDSISTKLRSDGFSLISGNVNKLKIVRHVSVPIKTEIISNEAKTLTAEKVDKSVGSDFKLDETQLLGESIEEISSAYLKYKSTISSRSKISEIIKKAITINESLLKLRDVNQRAVELMEKISMPFIDDKNEGVISKAIRIIESVI